ncbi:expressed unknown protein [Seminavis robusta]|uniref:Uncharacterized protein n=1 Tax=Seminavis robusta TaxID=568900 RepID=A0A9N8ETG2_9STRA|nr:expressed unknown protein [Seminavis robusta]|eukprot:Sro1639_g287830.1 n/a (525) ;mRNA; f:13974-15648
MSSSSLYIPGETIVPYQCTPGEEEEVTATVIRKIFSGLSVFGSSFILATIYQKWRRAPRSIDPYCRIMVGLSLYDIIWSFFPWFMGSWLMPAETGHYGASGNTQTCTMQGFFFWLGVPGAQYYQILLSLHTLLLVTFRWTPLDFHKYIERWSHGAIFFISVVLATIPLFFQGYNPECSTCLPAPLPIWCGDWIFWGDGETECLRGSPKLSQAYYTIYLTNLSIMGVFCTYSMLQVYWTVRKQEDRNSRYIASFQRTDAHRTKSRRIRRTMILYTFGFYLCWICPSFIIHFAKQGTPMMIMSYILLPFQGFFNMIIFLAPKCAKYQKDHPGTWLLMAYLYVLLDTIATPVKYVISGSSRQLDSMRPRQSSLRVRNPFRMSSSTFSINNFSWRGTLPGETDVTTQVEFQGDDDDDNLGFNDFNEDPFATEEPVPQQQRQPQRSTGNLMDAVKEEEELDQSEPAHDIKELPSEKKVAIGGDETTRRDEESKTFSADMTSQELDPPGHTPAEETPSAEDDPPRAMDRG